jgi:hypothetical protein
VGFAVVCKIKITKRQVDCTNADLCRDSHEIAESDTIYETINTSSEDLGMQIKMTNNDAYIQFHPSMGINVTNNEAYNVTNVTFVLVKQNSSYGAGHLQHFPKLNVAIDSYHSDGTEKQCKLDGTGLENPCTNTITTECLRGTVQLDKDDSCTGHIFDS